MAFACGTVASNTEFQTFAMGRKRALERKSSAGSFFVPLCRLEQSGFTYSKPLANQAEASLKIVPAPTENETASGYGWPRSAVLKAVSCPPFSSERVSIFEQPENKDCFPLRSNFVD